MTQTIPLDEIEAGDTVTIREFGNVATGLVEETKKPRRLVVRAFHVPIPFAFRVGDEWAAVLEIVEHQKPLIRA